MKQIISTIWHNIIILILFLLIFYSGMITGMYYENKQLTMDNKRIDKLETNTRELGAKVTVLETVTRKLK